MFRLRFPELRSVQGPLLFLDNDSRLEIVFDTEDPSVYTISGDAENKLLFETLARQDEMARQSVDYKNTIRNSQNPEERALANQQLQQLVNQSALDVKKIIEESKHLDPNLTAFLLNLLDPATNVGYIQAELKALKEQAPDSKLIAQMDSRFTMPEPKKNAGIAIGAIAPDIVQNNPNGQPVALSSLRGKYVLIDFWASWCRPCRFENPNVVRTYHKYKDKGFDIYSVSLDKNKDRWSKAIKEDNLVWSNHVSDLKAWSNEAARSYGVSSIPATFLIDPDGKVIARNLRGPALEEKLAEVMGSN
ncbi:MAG: TlpA family protein disulfide reductase [Bacteroidetes bacterium]|nr:TlpA family protein disulfide reductase [Bacteroidota bacterium]